EDPRARRAPLQRLSKTAAQTDPQAIRPALRQSGLGRADAERLRRRHQRRGPDDRALRRAAAAGLWIQRHRLSNLHPDGLPAPQQRPLLHHGIHARGLHTGGYEVARRQRLRISLASPLPQPSNGPARGREPVRSLATDAEVRQHMTEPLLQNKTLKVDPHKVGISYSGGGPLLLIEL